MTSLQRTVGAAIAASAVGLCGVPGANAAALRRAVASATTEVTAGASDQGAVTTSAPVSVRVYLAPQGGEQALRVAVDAVSDPSSPSYGQFLTPDQFRAKYQPTAATVGAVKSWLASSGLSVTSVEPAARYLTATGTAQAAEAAFATTLHRYSESGTTFQAPASAVTVPDAIAANVLAVSGLATKPHRMAPKATTYPAAFVNGRPCSIAYGQVPARYAADFKTKLPTFGGKVLPYAPCGYQPLQFRAAYEGNTTLSGAGATIAITDAYAAPTMLADANQYATSHGDPAFTKNQFTQSNAKAFTLAGPDDCDKLGWHGEETLDVEAVHAMAPAANIVYYGAASCVDADFGDVLDRVVDENKASIVTNSWGDLEQNETPDGIVAYEQAFQQGALQGISFLFSSGDNGDEVLNSGLRQADYPSSDPYITAVGGTATGIDASGAIAFQTGWGTQKFGLGPKATNWADAQGYLYGAGGGYSSLFSRPAYQSGVVPAVGSNAAFRAVPDVAMDADPTTGMLVGETQQFPNGPAYGEYRIGGTSLASPLMAGMQALTVQRTGKRQGLLNPAIYAAAKKTPNEFLDVSKPAPDAGNVRSDYANGIDASGGIIYSVRTFNQDSGLDGDGGVKPGWDEITGIGVPSQQYLAKFGG